MAYTSSQIVQAVPTGINSALVLVKSQVIGTTVSSVTVTNAFSATYNTYKIIINGGVGSTAQNLLLTVGATVTNYKTQIVFSDFNNTTATSIGTTTGTTFKNAGTHNTTSLNLNLELDNPFLAEQTVMRTLWANTGADFAIGILDNTTSYTDFTIAPTTGTITGGTIFVYGYAIS